jgi:hypothetical protein
VANGNLQPRNIVVALPDLARTAAIIGGSLSAGISLWVMRHRLLTSLGALLLGGLVGFVIGTGVGRLLYPAAEGNVLVVKAGQAALPVTLKAALAGAICSSIFVAACLAIFATPGQRLVVFGCSALA